MHRPMNDEESTNLYAKIDVENAPVGEKRIELTRKNFEIQITKHTEIDFPIKAFIERGSIEWVRVQENMLVPRARLKMRIESDNSMLAIKYKDKIEKHAKYTDVSNIK